MTWEERSCADDPQRWDLTVHYTLPGGFERAESSRQQRARHKAAQAECRTCPALELCRSLDTTGMTGVIAGRVLRDGKATREPVPVVATTEAQRAAHAAWKAGKRSDDILAGERAYQAARKRLQRDREAS